MHMNTHTIYLVADEKGFGWDPFIGKKVTPNIFFTEGDAETYLSAINARFPHHDATIWYTTGAKLIRQ